MYRDSFVGNTNIPPERVAIFDEAQRAWTHEQIERFMAQKKGVSPFPYSDSDSASRRYLFLFYKEGKELWLYRTRSRLM
jgi:hypothetical protein